MRDLTRVLCPICGLALILFVVSSCARPVSPLGGRAAIAQGAGTTALPGAGADTGSFIVRLRFVGPIVTLDREFQPRLERNADFFVHSNGVPFASLDTVPAHSVLKDVCWRQVRNGTTGPCVPDDSVSFVDDAPHFGGPPSDPSGEFKPGVHLLHLAVPPRFGGGRISVTFFVDFLPGAWWAGPDPALFPRSSDGDGRAVDVTDWTHFTTTPAWPPDGRRYFGPDSFRFVPSQRRPVHDDFDRRTFYEIFGDRIYARSEGDTVHLNAWVVLSNGGFDRDSRYVPSVDANDPALPPGFAGQPDVFSVLLPQGLLGSPTGFRSFVPVMLADGTLLRPSETTTYPDFMPTSVFRDPHLAGYWRATYPGRAYAVAMAVDAEGLVGRLAGDPVEIVSRVDAGGGTPAERSERRQILTFFVRASAPAAPLEAAR